MSMCWPQGYWLPIMRRITLYGIFPQMLLTRLPYAAESVDMVGVVNPLTAGAIVQTILGLLAVVAVIIAAAWLMRRVVQLQTGAQGALKVMANLSLGPRERVVLIQVGDQQLLLGVAPGHVNTLHVLEQGAPTTEVTVADMRFADRLKQILGQGASRGVTAKPGSPQ